MNKILLFAILVVGFLLITSLIRFLFGKKNQLGKAISAAMEIVFLYVICISVHCLGLSWKLFSEPLPFLTLENGTVQFLSISTAGFSVVCAQFTKLLLIAFLVNLLHTIIPEVKKLWLWLLLRVLIIVLIIPLNYALDLCLNTLLPQGIAGIAPFILLGILALLILLGSLKLIVGVALFVANPIIGALYTFFFANLVGRSLARAILSAGLITALIWLMSVCGILTFALSAASLLMLLPALLIVIFLWYLVDRIV